MLSRNAFLVGLALALSGSVGYWAGHQSDRPTVVTFVNVGQGDCTVVQSGGDTVLIDDGPQTMGYDAGARIILPKLRELGVAHVNLILLTHPDADHVGGTGAILRAFPDAKIGFSQCFRDRKEVQNRLTEWGVADDRVWWMEEEERVRMGDLRLRIHCPQISASAPTNDGSIFLRFSEGTAAFVITGDAPQAKEDQTARTSDWTSDVLHVGHHGSRTSTSLSWLAAVHPKFAVISCGKDNEYGHPHRAVLDRLREASATVLRTDERGDIQFRVRDHHFLPEP